MRPSLRRRGLAITVVAAAVAGAMTAATSPAAASRSTYFEPTSFARTDERAPHTTITTGDAKIGAYRDAHGRRHVSKSYFTFDVARLRGLQLLGGEFNLQEIAANDCDTQRAVEVWLAEPARHAPTWAHAPKEILKLDGPGNVQGCPPEYIGFSVGEAIATAIDKGWDTLTLVVRVARGKQDRLEYGRTYEPNPPVLASYNTAPNVPTHLQIGYRDCGADPMWTADNPVQVSGWVSDPDNDFLKARIAWWPVDDPASRGERLYDYAYTSFSTYLSDLTDGRTYAWQARTEDPDGAVSAWTEPCTFTLDRVRPSAPPTVSSTTYPPDVYPGGGGDGIAGDFTFTANGVPDVVGFEWDSWAVGYGHADADQPGGSATVSLTPTTDGPVNISVRSIDRAGNRSDATDYRFWVPTTEPRVNSPLQVVIGDKLPATFTAVQAGATTFTYQLDELPEVTLPVGEDGTASVEIHIPEGQFHTLRVWSTNADGLKSGVNEKSVYVDLGEPEITIEPYGVQLDEPVEVTFAPGQMRDVVSYTYWTDPEKKTTVPAGPDGTARITFVPDAFGGIMVSAFSTTASGLTSGTGEGYGYVDTSEPVVTSAEYPNFTESGAPGTPGTFHFAAPLPNVAEYRYSYDYGEEIVVPAAADGTADVTITPDSPGYKWLHVTAVSVTGRVTGMTSYAAVVAQVRPQVTGAPTAPVAAGTQVTLELTATQPGATEFMYSVAGVQTVVPAVDGKATVTLTAADPNGWGYMPVSIYSRTATGAQSGEAYVQIGVTRT
jgi:hypothetical protein